VKSEEERVAISRALSDRPKSQEHRYKLAEAIRGRRFYNNGKVEIQIHGNPPDGFVLGRLSEYAERLLGDKNPNAGNFLWTNGVVELRGKECPGEDFIRGKIQNYVPPVDLFK
jgi:hypothetical protein